MRVSVRLFASAREAAGQDTIDLDLPGAANVDSVLLRLGSECPRLAPHLPHVMVAVNTEYADRQTEVHEGDEIAIIPPVSGGS